VNDYRKMVELELRKADVWANGRAMPGRDRRVWRRDAYGSVIRYCDFGNRSSPYGWEIERAIVAIARRSEFAQQRPLHWRHNLSLQRAHSVTMSNISSGNAKRGCL